MLPLLTVGNILLFSLCWPLSLFVSVSLFLSPPLSLSPSLSIFLFLFHTLSHSLHLSLSFSLSLSLSLSLALSLSLLYVGAINKRKLVKTSFIENLFTRLIESYGRYLSDYPLVL